MNNIFTNLNSFTHSILSSVILPGDNVIDATIGNGNDTLYLAQKVGSKGRVYGFDIQKEAIENTSSLLSKQDVFERVTIIHDGHENMSKYIKRPIKVVMFNLGYLPQSDHQVITLPQTTIEALNQAIELLQPGGVITITIYPGHQGGELEKQKVDEFLLGLDKRKWDVLNWSFVNRSSTAPYLNVIHRRGG